MTSGERPRGGQLTARRKGGLAGLRRGRRQVQSFKENVHLHTNPLRPPLPLLPDSRVGLSHPLASPRFGSWVEVRPRVSFPLENRPAFGASRLSKNVIRCKTAHFFTHSPPSELRR
jgi:hypothetical protein